MRKMKLTNAVVSVALIAGLLSPMQAQATEIATEDVMDVIEVTTEDVTEEVTEEVTEVVTEDVTEEVTTEEATEEVVEPSADEVTDETSTYHRAKITAFVERFYTKALRRKAEPAGKAYWVEELMSGRKTPAQVGYFFFTLDEYESKKTSDTQYIEDLYQTYMDRSSDAAGMAFWQECLTIGVSRSAAMASFLNCKEFREDICRNQFGIPDVGFQGVRDIRRSTIDNNVAVPLLANRVYKGLLRRNMSVAESLARSKQFYAGNFQFHDFVYSIMKSEECIWKETTEEDFVRRAYRAILNREPSPSELQHYLAQLASVHRRNNNPNFATYSKMSRKEVLYELMRTPEFVSYYQQSILPAGVRPLAVPVITGDTIIDIDQEYISRMVKKRVFDKYPKLTEWNTDVDFLSRRDVSHDWSAIVSHVPKNCTFFSPFTDEDHIDVIAWMILDRMEGMGCEPGTYDGFAGFAFERDATQNPITGEISYGFYFQ